MDNVNFKKILFLILPMVFAIALAITLAACMAQANRGLDDSLLPSDTTTAEKPVMALPSTLNFKKNGDGTCTVVGIGKNTDAAVAVPEKSPDGDTVIAIGDSAFLGCTTLRLISLPTSVRSIGAYAFYGSALEEITLGANISSIGECAFANCPALVSVTVETANEKYSSIDGVLFSKDKSELIIYPTGKENSSYTIRASVKKIHTMAFYGCAALKSVTYNGTRAEWQRVEIGANNDSLTELEIKFPNSNK